MDEYEESNGSMATPENIIDNLEGFAAHVLTAMHFRIDIRLPYMQKISLPIKWQGIEG